MTASASSLVESLYEGRPRSIRHHYRPTKVVILIGAMLAKQVLREAQVAPRLIQVVVQALGSPTHIEDLGVARKHAVCLRGQDDV